jgi:EmrB/QacA subfamily drug resistance transporter
MGITNIQPKGKVSSSKKAVSHNNIILLVLSAAALMDTLDSFIVNVAMPTISKSLNIIGDNNLQWLITAYGLAFAGFLILAGRLADIYGKRRIFIIGVSGFGIASLLAGLSSTFSLLIICRGLQGLGAAFISAAALSSLLSIFEEGKARNRAVIIWGTVNIGGATLGVVLGGLIVQYINWHWIFFINVPISVLILIATPFFIPKLAGHGIASLKKFDLLGTFLVTSGLITLIYGLTKAPSYGWADHRTIGVLVVSVILLGAFIINELRVPEPLLNLHLFTKGNVGTASLLGLLVTGTGGTLLFFLSIYNQQVLGYSPVKSGLSVLPLLVLLVGVLQVVRKLLDKFGYKKVIIGQLIILAIGYLTLLRLPVSGHYISYELPSLIILGLGVPAGMGITLAATSGVKKEETGTVSGVYNTATQIGGPLMLAILSTIAATYTTRYAATNTKLAAEVHGIHAAFITSTAIIILATILCVLSLKQLRIKSENSPKLTEEELL